MTMRLEQLESRETPSITMTHEGETYGRITIQGDAANDRIMLTDYGNGRFVLNGVRHDYGMPLDFKICGGKGNDTIRVSSKSFCWIEGQDGNDTIYGGSGDDLLYGGSGRDSLYGGYGDDYLQGGDDNDYLNGGAGDDYLSGGRGADTLYGGYGIDTIGIWIGQTGPADKFYFAPNDYSLWFRKDGTSTSPFYLQTAFE
jgi:Ca2+-binding RTX toxin-like protein